MTAAAREPCPDPGSAVVTPDTATPSSGSPVEGEDVEPEKARLERLGRQRPEKFRSTWEEVGFVYSVAMSQILSEYFVSGFTVIIPTVARSLDIPASTSTWPANAFSLVISAFLLPAGRIADIRGGYIVYICGMAWLTVWSIITGFAQNELMLDFCRAIQGLGPAAFLPSSLQLLGSIYRPGPRKNVIFSIYGACAPLGFYIGIFFAGIAGEYTTWRVYFWIGAALALSTFGAAYFCVPNDAAERKGMGVKMDWWGTALIACGLILVVYAITDSSHAPAQWATPYIYVTLIVGVLLLGVAVYVEGWVAAQPLLPFDLFRVKHMSPLTIALFFSYGSFGIYLLYSTYYMTNIMGGTPMQLVAWFTPMALGGCIIATVGGFLLHLLPGTILVLFSGACFIISPLLFAVAPPGANYWCYTFWSMLCATLAIDITFNVTNIFISTSLPSRRQGLAGALINSILQLGIAFFLGFADVVAVNTADRGERRSYKVVFWFELASGATALAILVLFVRLKEAGSDLTADEKEELQRREAGAVQDGTEQSVK